MTKLDNFLKAIRSQLFDIQLKFLNKALILRYLITLGLLVILVVAMTLGLIFLIPLSIINSTVNWFVLLSGALKLRGKNNRIERALFLHEQLLLTNELWPFNLGKNFQPPTPTLSLSEFVKEFITDFNRRFNTFNSEGYIICTRGKRRSLGDIYLICKNYYPDCTMEEVLRILIDLTKEHSIVGSYCNTIYKYVFHNLSHHNSPEDPVEYLNKTTFQDIINYLNNEETNTKATNYSFFPHNYQDW